MKRAVIFDIDGTLSNPEHRLHFVRDGRKDWDAFLAGMGEDDPVSSIVDLARIVSQDCSVLVCTGRPEKYREVTEWWLEDFGVAYSALYMRPDNDTRPDHVIKSQILDGIRDDGYEPWLVID